MLFDPIETIRKEIETWDSPFVELDCFGTADAAHIVDVVGEFCRVHLGSGIRGYYFYRASIGSVHGIQLEDGRDLIIKVRPPPDTNPGLSFDRTSLGVICSVMNWLADRGYPRPKIILGPTRLGKGFATVEELLERGERGNGFEPECRRLIASGFAELIDRLRSFPVIPHA
jgi:hypothetical protein